MLEMRRVVGDRHRHKAAVLELRAVGRHRVNGGQVRLVGQRTGGELIPRGLHGGEVADPQVEHQSRAEQTQRAGQQ